MTPINVAPPLSSCDTDRNPTGVGRHIAREAIIGQERMDQSVQATGRAFWLTLGDTWYKTVTKEPVKIDIKIDYSLPGIPQ